jgi:hypothetical protein
MNKKSYNLNNAADLILECQKNIILNKQCIRELEKDGLDTGNLRDEITELEVKIKELKKVYEPA